MLLMKTERFPIRTQNDIVNIRKVVRAWTIEIGLGIIDQTKVITAASELARNTLEYGGGGDMDMSIVKNAIGKPGIKLIFEDKGPGIADLQLALTDGYTSGNGLGMGLTGSKRLMSEFDIQTEVGKGTSVTVIKWK